MNNDKLLKYVREMVEGMLEVNGVVIRSIPEDEFSPMDIITIGINSGFHYIRKLHQNTMDIARLSDNKLEELIIANEHFKKTAIDTIKSIAKETEKKIIKHYSNHNEEKQDARKNVH